jgi:cation:H+ antiporter
VADRIPSDPVPESQRSPSQRRNPLLPQPSVRRRKGRGQGGAFGGRGQIPRERPPRQPRPPRYAERIVERSLAGVRVNHRRNLLFIAIAMLITLPGLYFRLIVGGHHGGLEPVVGAITFGAAVVGAAFILSWAAEAAEMDISRGLAIAFLALIAVLPEYAVDMYFAWQAGLEAAAGHFTSQYASFATANMTGANRLLIGVAWSMVVFIFWFRTRQRVLQLHNELSVELVFLTLATFYALTLPLRDELGLLDTLVFVALFAWYMVIVARSHSEEPELVGPALSVGLLPRSQRRLVVVVFFAFAAAVILSSAEPFAESLVDTGKTFGIDEFLLVQWLAPLASEAPEVIVAFLFAWRGHAVKGLAALVSSKVNQWTLLIGTLPVVYSVAFGGFGAMHLDLRQREEILLTAAQSFFAVALLANFRISVLEAAVLFGLFATQLVSTDPTIRLVYSAVYMVLGVIVIAMDRGRVMQMVKTGMQLIRSGGQA